MATDRPPRQKIAKPESKIDNVLADIVNRGLRSMYLHHAKQRGATDEWCKSLENTHPLTVVQVVTIIYGDPPTPGEIKPEDLSKLAS